MKKIGLKFNFFFYYFDFIYNYKLCKSTDSTRLTYSITHHHYPQSALVIQHNPISPSIGPSHCNLTFSSFIQLSV